MGDEALSSMGLSVKAPEEPGTIILLEEPAEPAATDAGLGGGVRRRLLASTGGLALAAGVFGTINGSTLTVFPVLAKISKFGPS